MTSFAVVAFTEQDSNGDESESIEVVPISWISGDMCYWPHYKSTSKIKSAVKKQETPIDNTWELHRSRCLHKFRKCFESVKIG